MFRPCIVIPIYNNCDTIAAVLARLANYRLPCLIVDDGSNAMTRQELIRLKASLDWIEVIHRPHNGGKGAAVKDGLLWANAQGYSHALQVDADGQHYLEDVPRFLEVARQQPDCLVLGSPLFDASVPKARLHGRKLSVWMAWLETLSLAIDDPLFGFRVYPVAAATAVIGRSTIGNRMDFDPELAVRMYWYGLDVVNLASPVIYPEGGTSHFRMVADNLRLSWLHTRLTFGMIVRLPHLIRRHFGPKRRTGGKIPSDERL